MVMMILKAEMNAPEKGDLIVELVSTPMHYGYMRNGYVSISNICFLHFLVFMKEKVVYEAYILSGMSYQLFKI